MASFASSYIKTENVAVTRNSDLLTYASAGNVNGTAGSVVAEWSLQNIQTTVDQAIVSSGSMNLLHIISPTTLQFYDGTNLDRWTVTAMANGAVHKNAATWTNSLVSGYLDGAKLTPATMPTLATLPFGAILSIANNGGTGPLFGTIKNIRIYPRALSDAKLIEMTS